MQSDSHPLLPVLGDKPRGFAFITFSNALDAQDAIDNYDMNELPGHEGKGKYLKVNLARPDTKTSGQKGDVAGTLSSCLVSAMMDRELTDTNVMVTYSLDHGRMATRARQTAGRIGWSGRSGSSTARKV